MNIRTEFFLAWRYLKPKRNAVSVITCISVIGVMLGVGVLIVVLAVMTGFTDLMKKKLLETTAHIQISDYHSGYIRKPERIVKKIEKCGATASPIVFKPALIQKGERFVPKAVIGIKPSGNAGLNIKGNIKYGSFSLRHDEVLISDLVAAELGVFINDKILIHSPNKLSKMVETKKDGGVRLNKEADIYLPDEYRISGIFSFGKYDFDKEIVFLNLDDADDLFELPWGAATSIFVWTKDPFNMNGILKKLKYELPGMNIQSWKDINSKLLGVLAVEKNMMLFLLVFIVLVAAFSITNTLITVVVQKTREIGLLKAIGASSRAVMRIFILQGFFVGIIGTAFGNALGFAVVCWRNQLMKLLANLTGMEIFPKEFYFFNELPAHIVPHDIVVISVISVLLCTLGAVIPAWRAAGLDPARALRYE